MSSSSALSHRVVIGVIGILVVVAVGGYALWKQSRLVSGQVAGTILSVDATARTAKLQFVHPKTGRTHIIDGCIDPNCRITLDDKPATLADLKPGDKVIAAGKYRTRPSFEVIATALTATRGSTTQPTTATAIQPASQPTAGD